MQPLAIKCYLPGRRTQYALYPSEDMSIELGDGADLCPRGFDDGVRVQFRLIDGQWFVAPLLGKVCDRDGAVIDGQTALTLPAMLLAGSATLVLDSTVDPRVPARVIQLTADSARNLRVAPGPAPTARLSAVPRGTIRAHGSAQHDAWGGATSVAVARSAQPQVAAWQPAVAVGAAGAAPERAPTLGPRVQPSVVVQQAEEPAIRELTQTRILDMSQLGAQLAPAVSEPSIAPQGCLSKLRAELRANPRQLAYAVLFLVLVATQVGFKWRARAAAARATAAAAQAARSAAPAAPSVPSLQAPAPQRLAAELAPLAAGEEASPRRAGELFALGDFPNALRQYRALADGPEADPVFGVIAHSIEQRLRHPQEKTVKR